MEWLDVHAGTVQAVATLVLVIITAYYAWTCRAQVKATHTTLQAAARMGLQARLDHVSDLLLGNPDLFQKLDDPEATGAEKDERFHLANILVAVLEEAYVQHHIERSMSAEEWRAWESTLDSLMRRRYLAGYWRTVRGSYGGSFSTYMDGRLSARSD